MGLVNVICVLLSKNMLYLTMAGEWENDERSGDGTYYYINGDVYEGQWKYNKKHGKGVYTCASTKLKVCYLLFLNNDNNNDSKYS